VLLPMRNNGTSVIRLRGLWLCFFLWVPVPAFGQPPQRIRFASLVSKVEPVYPAAARRNGVQGAVWLDAVIGEDGRVVGVQPISGNPVLMDAAKGAVMQWVYRPTLLNGGPIQVITKVCVPFVRRASKQTPSPCAPPKGRVRY